MRIDRIDPADEPGDARMARAAGSSSDESDPAGKDNGKAVSEGDLADSSPARSGSALRTEQRAAYCANVDAVYRQHSIERGGTQAERFERQTVTITAIRSTETEQAEVDSIGPDDRTEGERQLTESAGLEKVDTPRVPGGDIPDDPRNYSNPKTGRIDASWSAYDRAITAAREHSGGDLGPDRIKMYDYNPEIEEGTGTLIGEQTPDRLRGWRIDSQDGHVNWWDWTGGKKGSGGAYGHDWFPEDPSTPGSRYIGWAPWQDSDGNIHEGN